MTSFYCPYLSPMSFYDTLLQFSLKLQRSLAEFLWQNIYYYYYYSIKYFATWRDVCFLHTRFWLRFTFLLLRFHRSSRWHWVSCYSCQLCHNNQPHVMLFCFVFFLPLPWTRKYWILLIALRSTSPDVTWRVWKVHDKLMSRKRGGDLHVSETCTLSLFVMFVSPSA